MNFFLSLDQQIFLFLNQIPHNAYFNAIAFLLSGVGTAGIVWLVLGAIMFFREEKKDHWFALKLGTLGFVAWGLVEQVIKPLVGRPRPSPGLDGFSFPSGHATIAFAMAVLLSQKEPRWKWVFYLLAVVISFSRVYLGVHYPLDVVSGAVLGWILGRLVRASKIARRSPRGGMP